jgi:hypothetical protein
MHRCDFSGVSQFIRNDDCGYSFFSGCRINGPLEVKLFDDHYREVVVKSCLRNVDVSAISVDVGMMKMNILGDFSDVMVGEEVLVTYKGQQL